MDDQKEGLPFGIIDPDYARAYTIARTLAWQEGYAIALHGSFTRDLDLIAIPWTDAACEPEHLVRRIEAAAGLKNIMGTKGPGEKPHGRLVWTLTFDKFGDPRFIDLSILPRTGRRMIDMEKVGFTLKQEPAPKEAPSPPTQHVFD